MTRLGRAIAAALILGAAGCGWLNGSNSVAAVPQPTAPVQTATPVATASPVPTATPTATAVPTATPTPPPASALTASTSSLTFNNVGSNCGPTGSATCAQTFTASETNYTGQLSATSSNPGVATVTPAQATGPTTSFTVTPVAAGTATITITDANAQKVTVTVTVSTTPLIIQSRKTGAH